jgi:hypothetical protein
MLTATLVAAPVLFMLGRRVVEGRFVSPTILWRSSPPGVDVLSFFLPNPGHPLNDGSTQRWLTADRPDGYVEFTASLPWTALAVIAIAAIRRCRPWPTVWMAFTLVFALLALGPFVHVGHVNTHIPGPWALLRYVPIIGFARSPSRFTIVVTLGVVILFAWALERLAHDVGPRRRLVVSLTALLLAGELCPVPRPLYAAALPSIYDTIAADPDHDIRVLTLPFGIRDGTSSTGNFSAFSMYAQTRHNKAIIGGYLSRVSHHRWQAMKRFPVLTALAVLSEGKALDPVQRERAWRARGDFVARTHVGYVIISETRASPDLKAFATSLLDLVKVQECEGYSLYRIQPGQNAGSPVLHDRSDGSVLPSGPVPR